jgi:hypothetical protein
VCVRDGLEGELIHRHEDAIRRKFGCFFFKSATKAARFAGLDGP